MDPFAAPTLNVPAPKPKPASQLARPLRDPCSRIDEQDLTVGAIRYSFLQLRNCEDLTPATVLWSGITAGEFALSYLLLTSNMQRRKSPGCRRGKAAGGSQ